MATRESSPLPPIQRRIVVLWSPEQAFRHFTVEMGSWWPLHTHSVCGDDAQTVQFEARVEGRILERGHSGQQHEWGRVLAWDPPHLVRFSWYPGRGPESATQVELQFTPQGSGTQVVLVHSQWERLGPLARKARRGYPLGWAYVLSLYAGRRGPLVITLDLAANVAMRIARLRPARRVQAG